MITSIIGAWSGLTSKLQAIVSLVIGFVVGAVLVFIVETFAYNGLSLPLIGQVIDGRMQTAVKDATAALVDRAEYDAAVAGLRRMEIEQQTANAAAAALRSRFTQSQKAISDAEDRLNAELAANKKPGRTTPSDADHEWMRDHPWRPPR